MRSQTDSQCELTTVDSTLASVTSISARFVRHVVVPAQTGSRSTIKTSQRAAAAYCYGSSRVAAATLDHYAIRLAASFYDVLAARCPNVIYCAFRR